MKPVKNTITMDGSNKACMTATEILEYWHQANRYFTQERELRIQDRWLSRRMDWYERRGREYDY